MGSWDNHCSAGGKIPLHEQPSLKAPEEKKELTSKEVKAALEELGIEPASGKGSVEKNLALLEEAKSGGE